MFLPREKYKIYTDNKRKVVASSTFAGKPVRGVAVCAEGDTFNLEKGTLLAIAKCDYKIAEKRQKYARELFIQAHDQSVKMSKDYHRVSVYFDNAAKIKKQAYEELQKLLTLVED